MSDPKIRSLEVMPDEYKKLYVKFMLPLLKIDDSISPPKLAELEKLMIRINLHEYVQREILDFVFANNQLSIKELIKETDNLKFQNEDEEKAFKYSLIKDMMYIALSDGFLCSEEREIINEVTFAFFNEQKEDILSSIQKAIKTEKDFLEGKIGIKEYEKRIKDVTSLLAGLGVPVVAVYFAGSVVGLSAAGITSGLAALGFGGLLGLSSMVTGIGVVIAIGVGVYTVARWLLGFNEREAEKKREELIQEVIKSNQKAIEKLTELYVNMSEELSHLLESAEHSKKEIEFLKKKVNAYKKAFEYLKQETKSIVV